MATVTKPIILNETYGEKMEKLISALTGMSRGAVSVCNRDETSGTAEISPNVTNVFPKLTGGLTISFAPAVETLDCEWVFIISLGNTAQAVRFPNIEWYLGIAPSFEANTTTEVRVHRVGDKYKGVWIS